MRSKSISRILALIIAVVIAAGPVAMQPAYAKSDAKLKTKLVSSVVKYDYYDGKWRKTQKDTYTYSKSYPKSITSYQYSSKSKNTETFKYTFRDNGNPKKMERYNNEGDKMLTCKYRKNGTIRTIDYDCSSIVWRETFQYGAGKHFTIKIHEETRTNVSDDPNEEEYADEVDYVTVTRRNGLLKKTLNRGIFANYDNVGTNKNWTDFMGTYTANYDSDGIISDTYAKFKGNSAYNTGKQLKFELKKKDGRIVQVIQYKWYKKTSKSKGSWRPETKYVLEYGKKTISKYRFANMINDILMGENNYYAYMWY